MYDDYWSPPGEWRDGGDGRVQHLVFADGLLVDTWSEGLRGSRYQALAAELLEDLRPACRHVTAPPPRPPHDRVLDWLAGVVGGEVALASLTDDPPGPPDPPEFADPREESAYAEAADQLERVAGSAWSEEVLALMLDTLTRLWHADSGLVTRASGAQVAGGVIWVVAKANNLFTGTPTQQELAGRLGLRGALSGQGQRVAAVLRGVDLWGAQRPLQCPALEPFANPDLLLARTRALVVRWRDEALAAQARAVTQADDLS